MKILLPAFLMLCMFKVQAAPPIDLSHAVVANYNNQLHPYNLPHDLEKAESPTFLRIVAYALVYTGGALHFINLHSRDLLISGKGKQDELIQQKNRSGYLYTSPLCLL